MNAVGCGLSIRQREHQVLDSASDPLELGENRLVTSGDKQLRIVLSRAYALRVALIASVGMAGGVGCGGDSTTGASTGSGGTLEAGVPMNSRIRQSGEVRTFEFTPAEDGEFVVFMQAFDAELQVRVLGPGGALRGGGWALQNGAGDALFRARTGHVAAVGGTTYTVEVSAGAPTRFRLLPYVVNRAPELLSASASLDQLITGETLENSADIDEFILEDVGGRELVGFILGEADFRPGLVYLSLLDEAGGRYGLPATYDGGTELEAHGTGRITVSAGNRVRVMIAMDAYDVQPPLDFAGAYRWQVRSVNRAPENAIDIIPVGDTVESSLEHVGDVDEYTLSGIPGQPVNLFFQAAGAGAEADLKVLAVGFPWPPDGVRSAGTDTSLLSQASGRFLMPESGVLRLVVQGYRSDTGMDRGPYRLWVAALEDGPESTPAELTLGGSISGESIEVPGDLDRYTLHVPSASSVNFRLVHGAGSASVHVLSPLRPVDGLLTTAIEPLNDPSPDGKSARTGRINIPAGDFILEVISTQTDGMGYRGPFLLETVVLDSAPEEAAEAVTLDSDVVETLFPVGDRDVFRLSAQAGDVLEAEFTGLGGSPSPGGWVSLSLGTPGPASSQVIGDGVEFLPAGNTVQFQRFTLPVSGEYRLIADSDSRYSANQGQYRFRLRRFPTGPETAPATLSVGEVLTAEQVDALGDVDDFEVQALPGSTLGAAIELVGGSPGIFLGLHWLSEPERLSIKSTGSSVAPGFLGRLEVPGTGRVLLRVAQGRSGGEAEGFSLTGQYRLWTYSISRGPESVTADFDWGVVKEGESIDPIGDLDEFAFAGTAGQRIRAYFEVPNGFSGGTGATMEILGPSGDVLGAASVINATPDIRDTGTGVITLPGNGTYLLRVRGTDDWNGPGNYRFLVETE